MGHRGSKIGFSGINRDGFFMKIMFSRSACVRNVTFDRVLKIFGRGGKREREKEKSFFKIVKNQFEPVKKSEYPFLFDFSIFLTIFDGVTLSGLIVLA